MRLLLLIASFASCVLALPSQLLFNAASSNLVPVTLGVMSRCPDAQICEQIFDRVFTTGSVKDKVQPELIYLGTLNSSASYGVTCKHGPAECRANVQQLCVQRRVAREQWQPWWAFVNCQRFSPGRIGDDSLARECARLAKFNWDDIEDCVDSKEGSHLLQDSVRLADKRGIVKSCSMYINKKLVCVRDGSWQQCENGHEAGDFIDQIQEAYKSLN